MDIALVEVMNGVVLALVYVLRGKEVRKPDVPVSSEPNPNLQLTNQ